MSERALLYLDDQPAVTPLTQLEPLDDGFLYRFSAMASPCEVHIEGVDEETASRAGKIAEDEALRIERKFSRYRPDSALSLINAAQGRPVEVDAETAALIDYADKCHTVSGGRFDITSGVLRKVWRFDGSDRLPGRSEVDALRPLIGWRKVSWRTPQLTLPPGMEIDFGGLGKEYAVDCAIIKIRSRIDAPVMVNLGGDLRVSGPRQRGGRWRVAIESVDDQGRQEGVIEIANGALTTSGDARRFLLKDGVRYSHILDPRTGWPVKDPPRSVTVAAPTCIEAGLISTLAMLHGRGAERFLKQEGVSAWWVR